jgi:hypothetical protein
MLGDLYKLVITSNIIYSLFTSSHLTELSLALSFNKLTPWSRAPLEKQTVTQLVKKFPAVYGARRFITMFTIVRHWSLLWAIRIQSTHSHLNFLKSILILSYHLRLDLPSVLS